MRKSSTPLRATATAPQEALLDALVERRLEEALIFLYGDYGFGGTPLYEYEYKELEDDDYELFHRVWEEYSPAKFSDVPYSQWYYQYVSPLACAGIMDGYEDGSFLPAPGTHGGRALKLVLLAAGYPAQGAARAHTGPAAISTLPSPRASSPKRT